MTHDHKTVREAFEKEWPNWDKYPSGNYMDEIVQTAWENFQSGYAAALDRIEAVETVTEVDFETFMAETLCMMPRSICVEDLGQVPTKAIMKAYPNGLRIVKEK